MTSDRKRPTDGFWIAVALVAVLVGYPLSFGPACWIHSRTKVAGRAIWVAYYPVAWAANQNHAIDDGFLWYARIGAAESRNPVFGKRELYWESAWQTLVRCRNRHRWNYAATSALAPSSSR